MTRTTLLTSAVWLVCSPAVHGDDRTTVTDAAEGFRANLRAAARFRCEYTVTVATAASVSDLLLGRYTGKPQVATGRAVRAGDRWTVRTAEDATTSKDRERAAKTPAAKPWPGKPGVFMGTAVPFVSNSVTTDGTRGLNYGPRPAGSTQPETANLTDGGDVLVGADFITELSHLDHRLGFPTLADGAARGEVRVTDLSTGPDGLLRVTLEPRDLAMRASFTLDTRRGYLPVRREDRYTTDSLVAVVELPDVAACGEGWFPTRAVQATYREGQDGFLGRDYRLTNFDPNYRATDADFEVVLPANTVVCRYRDPRYHFRTKQSETVNPNDLDRLWQLTADNHAQHQARLAGTADHSLGGVDTAVRPTWRVPWWGWWTGSLGAVLVLAALVQFGRIVLRGRAT